MPAIYLSPSTQEYNRYVNGGSEVQVMNDVVDAMIPYLLSSGIQYTRNSPSADVAQSIRESNSGNFDLHVALHSNASPENMSGQLQGTDVYFRHGAEVQVYGITPSYWFVTGYHERIGYANGNYITFGQRAKPPLRGYPDARI